MTAAAADLVVAERIRDLFANPRFRVYTSTDVGGVELGGAVKDLEMGLVDFPGLIDDTPVNLCWKHGEDAVRFWHGLDEVYARRKPLP